MDDKDVIIGAQQEQLQQLVKQVIDLQKLIVLLPRPPTVQRPRTNYV